jgi:translation initiation factor 1
MARKGDWREFDQPGETSARRGIPAETASSRPPSLRQVRVQRTRAGRGGRTVTVVTGLEMDEREARTLLKRLKAQCGSGGTVRDGVIELQGDQVQAAIRALEGLGFRPRQAGG